MDASPGEQIAVGSGRAKLLSPATMVATVVATTLGVALLLMLILAALGALGQCVWTDLCGPVVAEDTAQGRLDTALPAPQGDSRIEQTFTPRRNGLSEIEITLVRYGGEATAADPGTFSVALYDEAGALVTVEHLPTQRLTHNQVYLLRFPPQADSAGRRYTLRLSGNEHNPVSAWGYSLDVDAGGALQLAARTPEGVAFQTAAADLRYVTRYTLTAGDAVIAALTPAREWRLLLAALLFLPLPGVWLLLVVRPRGWDRAVWWGAALSLGVAGWPVLWQWVSLAGGRWSGGLLWGVVVVGWAAAAVIVRRSNGSPDGREPQPTIPGAGDAHPQSAIPVYILLVILILVTTASRFVAVRDLAFPPWVDSSRHALITAVMLESGKIPTDYAPYLPVDHFPYHYGFHTLSASLILMTGAALPGALLFLMQLLGGLLPLAVYAAGWLVTRRQAVGLLAAFLVALPFFFPGYYVTWGRMTQLSAMVAMPVLVALTWRLGRGWRLWPLVGVLAAGVFLLHFRVFLFYLPFAALVAAACLLARRPVWGLVKAGLLGGVLVAPRLIELLLVTEPLATVSRSLPGYNDFPMGYITTGWERAFLVATGIAAAVVVGGLALRRRWVAFPLLLLLWVGALFALLAGERLGLPESLVVNLNSMYITLFLPQALLLAIVVGRIGAAAGRHLWGSPFGFVAAAAVGIVLGALAMFGWRQQINILNQQTVLALPQDAPALAWIDGNLPADARVAVSAWQWLGATWAGSDGGAWLVPLTGRESTTPPVDHIYNEALFADVRAFNEAATAITDWSDPAAADWLAAQGVTHLFVGRRGGYLDPAALSHNPSLVLLHDHDGTFVFAVAP
jgi:hypothetical protein